MLRYRPFLPTVWWCLLGLAGVGFLSYQWEVPFWILVVMFIGFVWPTNARHQIVIEDGVITFHGHGLLRIPMTRVARVRFSSMRIDLEDDHGLRVQMPIGWYSGRQLDAIIAQISRAQQDAPARCSTNPSAR